MTRINVPSVCCIFVLFIAQLSVVMAYPPIISGLPTTIYVGEDEQNTARWVHTFTTVDPEGQNYNCYDDQTAQQTIGIENNPNDQFRLFLNGNTNLWELWTTAASNFDTTQTNTTRYRVSIWCTDSTGQNSTLQYLDISVVLDALVTINNVEGDVYDITRSAPATPKGTAIKTVSATGVNLNFSLTESSTDGGEPWFTINSATGVIKANRDLKYLESSYETMYLTVSARDSNGITVKETQKITFTDQNTMPSTADLTTPKAITKLENQATGTVLYTVTAVDPDKNQGLTYRLEGGPTDCEDTFGIDKNGNVYVKDNTEFDYETRSYCELSIYIDDGIHEGGPFVLELTIADVNEAPYFTDAMQYITVNEGAKGTIMDTNFVCLDVDAGNTHTLQLNPANSSNMFRISGTDLAFDTNIDADVLSSDIVITVECVDQDGLTGSTQVTITVEDINDNAPTFSAAAYTVYFNQFTQPADIIGYLTPTDKDSGNNGEWTCTGLAATGEEFGHCFKVTDKCELVLKEEANCAFNYGSVTSFTATATDKGTNPKSGTAQVDFIYEEATTTTTTTTTPSTTTDYNFFDHGENIALLTLMLLMSAILAGLLAWCLARFCCGCCGGGGKGMCMQGGRTKMPRTIYPRSPPPSYETYGQRVVMRPVRTQFVQGVYTPGKQPAILSAGRY